MGKGTEEETDRRLVSGRVELAVSGLGEAVLLEGLGAMLLVRVSLVEAANIIRGWWPQEEP